MLNIITQKEQHQTIQNNKYTFIMVALLRRDHAKMFTKCVPLWHKLLQMLVTETRQITGTNCVCQFCLHSSRPSILLNVTAHIFNTINIDETTLKIISQFAVSIKPCLQFAPSHVHLHPDNVLIFSTVQTVSGDHLSISWVVSHRN